jgi:hypothetical protein
MPTKTVFPFSFAFRGRHLTFMILRDQSLLAFAAWAGAAVLWIQYFRTRRSLREASPTLNIEAKGLVVAARMSVKALSAAVRLRQRISDAARPRHAARQLEVRDRYCRGR